MRKFKKEKLVKAKNKQPVVWKIIKMDKEEDENERKVSCYKGGREVLFKGSEIGFLFHMDSWVHRKVCDILVKDLHNMGYSVMAPRLPGHGTYHSDLEKSLTKIGLSH